MAAGRSIRIHLADGNPKGIRVAQSPVRTCKVSVCPRAELGALRELVEDVDGPGVYVLVGEDPKRLGRPLVYVGESENVFERVKGHIALGEKEFQHVVFFVSTSDFLTKAHISWLERELIKVCVAADVATVTNANEGRATALPRSDTDDLQAFFEDMRLMLPVLGYDFAREPVKVLESTGYLGDAPDFEFHKGGAHATMKLVDGQYLVIKGSTARREGTQSWDSYVSLRDSLVTSGKLVPHANPELLEFAETVPFQSASAAATVVAAGNQSGPKVWKVKGGTESLKDWESKRLAQQEMEGPKSIGVE